MAGLDHTPIDTDRPVWDGQAVCRICATHDAEAEHEWCAATNALVCRDCCHRVLAGHVALIVTEGVAALDEDVPASVEACAGCDRGRRWFASHVAGLMTRGTPPN